MATTETELNPTRQPPASPAHPVLLEAARLIRERGLAKHALEDEDGRLCMIGAYNVAAGGDAHFASFGKYAAPSWNAMFAAVPGGAVISYNNHPDRTADDVAGLLERAAYGL